MKDYKSRFSKAKEKIRVTKKDNNNRIEPMEIAFLAALHLLARAKQLYYATSKEIDDGNSYSSFVLVRAYFETCMAIGFLCLDIQKKLKTKNFDGIWNTSHRILQGGKHFPKNNYYDKSKTPPVNSFHIYDFFDAVDTHIRTIEKKDKEYTPHREMYDTILSEFSHPSFMGLVTASYNGTDEKGMDYQEVDLERKGIETDRESCRNYLNWGGDIFFYYWDKLVPIFKEYSLNLPSLD